MHTPCCTLHTPCCTVYTLRCTLQTALQTAQISCWRNSAKWATAARQEEGRSTACSRASKTLQRYGLLQYTGSCTELQYSGSYSVLQPPLARPNLAPASQCEALQTGQWLWQKFARNVCLRFAFKFVARRLAMRHDNPLSLLGPKAGCLPASVFAVWPSSQEPRSTVQYSQESCSTVPYSKEPCSTEKYCTRKNLAVQ